MILFLSGFATGVSAWTLIGIILVYKDHYYNVHIENKVERMWKHLCCSAGVLGCPNKDCSDSHK